MGNAPDDPRWSTLDWALGAPGVFAWSPDSTRLAFSQVIGGIPGIWVIGADGAGLRQVGDPTLHARDPAWSPDGTRIVFHGGAEGPGGGNGVWVMPSGPSLVQAVPPAYGLLALMTSTVPTATSIGW